MKHLAQIISLGDSTRKVSPCIAEPLTKLFNMPMPSGELPRDWTRANILSALKMGSKHIPNNYIPVSLTSVVVKTMEHLIHR